MRLTFPAILILLAAIGVAGGVPPSDDATTVEEYWPDGTLRLRCQMLREEDGALVHHGRFERWHPNGEREYEAFFVHDKKQGTTLRYHDNGRKANEQAYENGKRQGRSTSWDAAGEVVKEETWFEGRPAGTWVVRQDGKVKWSRTFSGKEQTPTQPQGHLEVPRDRHLPPPPQPDTSRAAARLDRAGNVSVQVNVDANALNIVGDAANEPSIAVDPTDPTRIAIGWRQFDNSASDFRQAGYGYTVDGGASWTFPGVIDPGVFRSDPVLDSDADGNFFYNSLTADYPSAANFECRVYKSVDGGATWDTGAYAFGGDKQWQAIDTTQGIGRGNIYAAWNSSFTACSGNFTRSYDGGQTFLPCTTVAGDPYWGTIAVGPDGELYVSGTGMTIAKSTTLQDSALPAAWDFSGFVDLDGSLEFSTGPNPAGLLGQNWIAVDHSAGTTRGNLYMLASVSRSSTADPLDVMFARSTDGGLTWSAPVRVNDDPGTSAWQWLGTMSVAPNGRIDAIWLDTRNDPGGYLSELYYAFSTDAGVTWSVNEALSSQFDPHVGWPQQNKMGDYFDMVSDDLGVNLAYAATFNGEQDVYFIRIGDAACPDAGRLTLDRPKYGCDGVVRVAVLDCGLNTDDNVAEQTVVQISSDSEPVPETVTLTETAPASARFEGAIDLAALDGGGVLWVTEGDVLTASYLDADDGAGGTDVTRTVQAPVECTPPLISNVQTTDLQPLSATVGFDSDEPVRGTVFYGATCGALTASRSGNGFVTQPSVPLPGLTEDSVYAFAVEAEDEAGNIATDDNGGTCYAFTTPDVRNFFTQQFTAGLDLDGHTLTFTPDGSVDFYSACITPISALPTDPSGSTEIVLSDDDEQQVVLGGGATVSLYGVSSPSFWVVSNGYVTLAGGETGYNETYAAHFGVARVAALFDDLSSVSSGTISWKQLSDRAVATWQNVPELSGGSNTFQIELFFDGVITISHLGITTNDAIVGLSDGAGLSSTFFPTDLSESGSCGPRPPTALSSQLNTPIGVPLAIQLGAGDDGLPAVPGTLSYRIVGLPADGYLEEAGGGTIAAVPHALGGGGHQVVYVPAPGQVGPDSFQFLANDGGQPPDGGDSAVAMVTVLRGGPQPVHEFPLDTDPGWSTTGLWAFGAPLAGGSHDGDPASAYSGANVYGYEIGGDYTSDMPEEYLTSAPIDLADATNTSVEFRRWLGVESSTYDQAAFQVSANGVDWTTVWAHSGGAISENAWSLQSYDISAVADNQPAVSLRWVMGTTDGSVTYPGWSLDDIRLWGSLPSQSCVAAPGEATGLAFSTDKQTLVWNRPADMGGPVSPFYDLIRSDSPQGFQAAGVCVESDEGADTIAVDPAAPASQGVFYYLVRAENPCGAGSLGTGAAGERSAVGCLP
jgi:hypothetical protein